MRFLLDANMPRTALRVLTESGHLASHVRDLGLGDATDERIDQHAQAAGWILVTRVLDFRDTRRYPPEISAGRLVLRIAETSTAEEIAKRLRRFLAMPDLVARIPGHLVILEPDRARFRPALVSNES